MEHANAPHPVGWRPTTSDTAIEILGPDILPNNRPNWGRARVWPEPGRIGLELVMETRSLSVWLTPQAARKVSDMLNDAAPLGEIGTNKSRDQEVLSEIVRYNEVTD